MRRQFDLPLEDQQFLNEYGLPWETIVDGSQWVLIHDFPTHEGYNHPSTTAAIRIETGYPMAGSLGPSAYVPTAHASPEDVPVTPKGCCRFLFRWWTRPSNWYRPSAL